MLKSLMSLIEIMDPVITLSRTCWVLVRSISMIHGFFDEERIRADMMQVYCFFTALFVAIGVPYD